MLPIRRCQAVNLMCCYAKDHTLTPDTVYDLASGHGLQLTENILLRIISNIPVLFKRGPLMIDQLEKRYIVSIDNVRTHSRDNRYAASWIVQQMTNVFSTFSTIQVLDRKSGKVIDKWTRLGQSSTWIGGRVS